MATRSSVIASLFFGLLLVLVAPACDDGKDDKKQERKNVVEGGKAESAAGKQVEGAKKEIEAVEKTMEREDADRFERSGEEKVERGMP